MYNLDANYLFYSRPDWEEQLFPAFPESLTKLAEVADKRFEEEEPSFPTFRLDEALDQVTYNPEYTLPELFSLIEKDLSTYMPANPKVIAQKYKQLNNLLPELSPHEKERYDSIVNKAFFHKLSHKPRLFMGTPTEELVLKELGFPNISDYQDHALTIERARRLITEKLNSKEATTQPLSEIKKELKERIDAERISLAGIDPAHAKKIQQIVRAVWDYRKKFDEIAIPFKNVRTLQGDCEIARKCCQLEIHHKISQLRSNEVKNFLKENRGKLLKMLSISDPEEFKKALNEAVEQSLNDPQTKHLRKEKLEYLEENLRIIEWFNDYQDNITVQFSQGLQPLDECLGAGICLALVHRFIKNVLNNPECPDQDLKADEILPIDRFMQASSDILRRIDAEFDLHESVSFPHKLAKDYKEEIDRDSANGLSKALLHFDGVYNIVLVNTEKRGSGGHSIGIQIDREKHIFRMYDPNLGIVRIRSPQGDPDEALQQFAKMFDRYLALFYPKMNLTIPIRTLIAD